MTQTIQIVDPTNFPEWDSMLLRTPGASFFHGSAWARVLSESYGYTPLYFIVIENEKFRALVPVMEVNSFLTGKRGVSLPFTDYCDPLIDETLELADRVDLFNQIVKFGKERGWKYIELRGGGNLFPVAGSQFPVASSSLLAPGPSTRNAQQSLDLTPELGTRNSRLSLTRNPKPETRNGFPIPQSAIRNPQSEGSALRSTLPALCFDERSDLLVIDSCLFAG